MTSAATVAVVLALAVLFALARQRRDVARAWLRLSLQALVAVALYLCLFPPSTSHVEAAGEWVVLTPGATPAQLSAVAARGSVVALPEVAAAASVERVPDLGTALRRHPDAQRLRVVGGGLPLRDRDAARGLVASFDAAPTPNGLSELEAPTAVLAGNAWQVSGRVTGATGGRAELHDPVGTVVATQPLDAQGRFSLHAIAKTAGNVLFRLDVLDASGAKVDSAPVALSVRAGSPLKLLLLAGAPDPDLKYLRRWAADTGAVLDSRVMLSDGVALAEGSADVEAPALADADVVVVDERAWAALDASRKQRLLAAVNDGLGLMLRVSGPVSDAVQSDWAALGFEMHPSDDMASVPLEQRLGLADAGTTLTRAAIEVTAPSAATLLQDDHGASVAWLSARGRGRIALWPLLDSYRLYLAGASAAFGTLWADALRAVARAHAAPAPQLPRWARVDERALVCAVPDAAQIEDAAGNSQRLLVDAVTHCAAYWPAMSGWHSVVSGDQRWSFHVAGRDEAVTLWSAQTARATRDLLSVNAADAGVATHQVQLPRWPFYLALLTLVSLLWWLERRAWSRGV